MSLHRLWRRDCLGTDEEKKKSWCNHVSRSFFYLSISRQTGNWWSIRAAKSQSTQLWSAWNMEKPSLIETVKEWFLCNSSSVFFCLRLTQFFVLWKQHQIRKIAIVWFIFNSLFGWETLLRFFNWITTLLTEMIKRLFVIRAGWRLQFGKNLNFSFFEKFL